MSRPACVARLDVVFVGMRVAEHDQQPVALRRSDVAFIPIDRSQDLVPISADRATIDLGFDGRRQRGRIDEVPRRDRQPRIFSATTGAENRSSASASKTSEVKDARLKVGLDHSGLGRRGCEVGRQLVVRTSPRPSPGSGLPAVCSSLIAWQVRGRGESASISRAIAYVTSLRALSALNRLRISARTIARSRPRGPCAAHINDTCSNSAMSPARG